MLGTHHLLVQQTPMPGKPLQLTLMPKKHHHPELPTRMPRTLMLPETPMLQEIHMQQGTPETLLPEQQTPMLGTHLLVQQTPVTHTPAVHPPRIPTPQQTHTLQEKRHLQQQRIPTLQGTHTLLTPMRLHQKQERRTRTLRDQPLNVSHLRHDTLQDQCIEMHRVVT